MDTLSIPVIKGFQEVTLIDWEKTISSIIFLPGCNLRCGFCHSSALVTGTDTLDSIEFSDIKEFLRKKKGWIDGVVITGGEPLLEKKALFNLIEAIRGEGFAIKIDTNGTKPDALKELIDTRLADYIAMDIKTSFDTEKYRKATRVDVDVNDIIASKDILLNSNIDYEFRTTAVPTIVDSADIAEIAQSIEGAKKYCIQQFVPRDPIDRAFLDIEPYAKGELNNMVSIAREYLKNVSLKNS